MFVTPDRLGAHGVAREFLREAVGVAEHHRDTASPLPSLSHLCPECGSREHGRPLPLAGYHLSFSHSPGLSLVAISTQPIGVDHEPADRAPPPGHTLTSWTTLEARAKLGGRGLIAEPPRATVASLDLPDGWVGALAQHGELGEIRLVQPA